MFLLLHFLNYFTILLIHFQRTFFQRMLGILYFLANYCKHFIHCKFSQVTGQTCICCKIGTKEIEGRMFRKGSQKSNQLGHQLGWMAPIQERQTLLLRWID